MNKSAVEISGRETLPAREAAKEQWLGFACHLRTLSTLDIQMPGVLRFSIPDALSSFDASDASKYSIDGILLRG